MAQGVSLVLEHFQNRRSVCHDFLTQDSARRQHVTTRLPGHTLKFQARMITVVILHNAGTQSTSHQPALYMRKHADHPHRL